MVVRGLGLGILGQMTMGSSLGLPEGDRVSQLVSSCLTPHMVFFSLFFFFLLFRQNSHNTN